MANPNPNGTRSGSTGSDSSSADQLTLQQNMDLLSQFEAVFSNVLKSMSDTASSIVGNLKG